jgi:membrane fusion protein (multidrug efflux system)
LHQTTDDAYLQSDLTLISAKVPGYLRRVPVEDYVHVRAGQVIAEVVDDDYRAAVAQAQADVALAQAEIVTLERQSALQEANIHAARAVLAATRANLLRASGDLHGGYLPRAHAARPRGRTLAGLGSAAGAAATG